MRTRAEMKNTVGIGLVLLLLIAISCDDPVRPRRTPQPSSILDNTPREDYESEAAALWLSGDLVAPDTLYENLRLGFNRIRDAYRDSIPELDRVSFVAPWIPRELLIKLTESARRALRLGEYHDLDSLNTYYRVVEIDTTLLDFISWAHLIFEGRLHPERLVEFYRQVESLEYVEPNGSWNNTRDNYPWLIQDGISYLFREGWGDCPSGCIDNRFWYFKVYENTIDYLGTFVRRTDPYPYWWDEAKVAYEAKYGY